EGHPLLASWGRLSRELQEQIEEAGHYDEVTSAGTDLYVEPGEDSLLHALQSDLLHLRDRAALPVEPPALDLRDGAALPVEPPAPELLADLSDPTTSSSIEVHACHGPMREVEVLHDRLRDLFEGRGDLAPDEVIVMAPDIEAYAPSIEAVFAAPPTGAARIPFHIADRGPRATQPVIDAFERVLDLVSGRFALSAVLDVLAAPLVQARFGLDDAGLARVRAWLEDAGARWGIDAAHRASLGQPSDAANTLRFALDRLWLGLAMPTDERARFGDVLPYDDVAGSEAETLAALGAFCEAASAAHDTFATERPLPAQCEALAQTLRTFIAEDADHAREHQRVRDALETLAERARAADLGETPFSLDAARHLLGRALEATQTAYGFLSGGVTFCQLVPMRSVPFRVVCLLGMNDGALPRSDHAPSFDRVAAQRRPGDRSKRDDDQHLFLEALLCARERVVITYVGQDLQGAGTLPPSVLVDELLDRVVEGFAPLLREAHASTHEGEPLDASSAAEALRARLVTRHTLQPFSPENFDARLGPRQSFDTRALETARALVKPPGQAPAFITDRLPARRDDDGLCAGTRPEAPAVVTLDALTDFLRKPARDFATRRLRLTLPSGREAIEDREPIDVDGLARWALGESLLARIERGDPADERDAALRASGRLPLGTLGGATLEKLTDFAERIVHKADEHRRAARGPTSSAPEPFSLGLRCALPDEPNAPVETRFVRLDGVLDVSEGEVSVSRTFASVDTGRDLGTYVRHLFAQAVRQTDRSQRAQALPTRSVLVGMAKANRGTKPALEVGAIGFGPVDDARERLKALLTLYLLGEREPIPLPAGAARAFANERASAPAAGGAAATGKALEKARAHFDRARYGPRRDLDDPYTALLWPTFEALTASRGSRSFAKVAWQVYGPFLDARQTL
ncbi:MAG: exodeoxyribonuclease V subunit gamma, partial [Myxococcales bacterium]|nr:exodeoxyribonuclease V subunit gamma [Myxococcales bacterium]